MSKGRKTARVAVSDRLAKAVREFGVRAAADGAGMTESTVSRVISGERRLTVEQATNLAAAVGLRLELVDDEDTAAFKRLIENGE